MNQPHQLINEQMEYAKFEFNQDTSDYLVVSILGSQSSGKSTLLNRLFGATFVEMNANIRQQTTKGIWTTPLPQNNDNSKDNNLVIIMDVEGSDSLERHRQDTKLERYIAMFALSISDVLTINMWEHQIGLYNGNNMQLFNTIFEVNLDLFVNSDSKQEIKKKTILVVIRDFTNTTPLDTLFGSFYKEILEMWDKLGASCKIEKVFEFKYKAIRHKILQPNEFDEDCSELKKWFLDNKNSNYLFDNNIRNQSYHVPMNIFSDYMENIWALIKKNKKLDIPTQQSLVESYKIDEIIEKIQNEFRLHVDSIVDKKTKNVDECWNAKIKEFEALSIRFNPTITKEKKLKLENSLKTILIRFFSELIEAQISEKIKSIKQNSTQTPDQFVHFKEELDSVVDELKEFINSFTINSTKIQELDSFKQTVEKERTKIISSQRAKAVDTIVAKAKDKMQMEATQIMSNSALSEKLYETMFAKYYKVLKDCIHETRGQLNFIDCSPVEDIVEGLQSDCLNKFIQIIKAQVNNRDVISNKLKNGFEKMFKFSANNIPRVWTSSVNVEDIYNTCKERIINTIDALKKINYLKIEENIIDNEQYTDLLKNNMEHIMHVYYMEAKQLSIKNEYRIPYWIYVLLLVVGWNEIMVILSNPVYIVLLTVSFSIFFVLHKAGLLSPSVQLIKRFIDSCLSQFEVEKALNNTNNNKTATDLKEKEQQ